MCIKSDDAVYYSSLNFSKGECVPWCITVMELSLEIGSPFAQILIFVNWCKIMCILKRRTCVKGEEDMLKDLEWKVYERKGSECVDIFCKYRNDPMYMNIWGSYYWSIYKKTEPKCDWQKFIISLQRSCTNFSYAYFGAESSSLKPSSLCTYFKSAIKWGKESLNSNFFKHNF